MVNPILRKVFSGSWAVREFANSPFKKFVFLKETEIPLSKRITRTVHRKWYRRACADRVKWVDTSVESPKTVKNQDGSLWAQRWVLSQQSAHGRVTQRRDWGHGGAQCHSGWQIRTQTASTGKRSEPTIPAAQRAQLQTPVGVCDRNVWQQTLPTWQGLESHRRQTSGQGYAGASRLNS